VTATARRIQRKRTKGWGKPEGAVSVARPTRFGNPFMLAPAASRRVVTWTWAVECQGRKLGRWDNIADARRRCRPVRPVDPRARAGRHPALIPRAPSRPRPHVLVSCHADVLFELANGPARE